MTSRTNPSAHMLRAHMRGAISHSTLYILAAALAAGLGLWSAEKHFGQPEVKLDVRFAAYRAQVTAAMHSVTLFPKSRVLGSYSLRVSDGSTITPGALRGHWTLVFLGFTRCPDVCPTTLQSLGMATKAWESWPDNIRPRVLFVSVDPDRDTPKHVGEYAHYFGKDILGATADEKTLAAFARSLGMVYMKVPTVDGKDYTIDHSASVSVLDPDGNMAGIIRPPFNPAAIDKDMDLLVQLPLRPGPL